MENEMMEISGGPVVQDKTVMDVEVARAVAQIQGAMAVAKRFPRDEGQAMTRIVASAQRRKLAETAAYEYKRGGSQVTGPSIRAAEAISQAWGNITSGVTEVKRDNVRRESVMMAYAGDMETNTWKFVEFTVPHSIDTKQGAKALTASRDVYERTMNDGARRLRNCLLSVIPGDVVETFMEKCNETLSKDATPLVTRIQLMLKAMEEEGVGRPMIENQYGCKAEALSERQLGQLRRTYQALKDGFGKVEDYFKLPGGEATGKGSELNAKVKSAAISPAIKPNPYVGLDAYASAPDSLDGVPVSVSDRA